MKMFFSEYVNDDGTQVYSEWDFQGNVKDKSKEIRQKLETDSGRIIAKSDGWRYIYEIELIILDDAQAHLVRQLLEKDIVLFQPYDDKENYKFDAHIEFLPSSCKRKCFNGDRGYTIIKMKLTSVILHTSPPDVLTYTTHVIPVWPQVSTNEVATGEDIFL